MLRFFIFIVGLFFLSIPIPGFVPSDRFAWTGPLRLSFTDRRNSSLRKKLYVTFPSNTTGRAFGKPNRTLVPAPMVPEHEHRRRISNDRIILPLNQVSSDPSDLCTDRIQFFIDMLIPPVDLVDIMNCTDSLSR